MWSICTAGIELLDLPLEVLQAISSHIRAHEWAQGPAQSCRLLSRMDLPHVALHLPVMNLAACATFEVPNPSLGMLCSCKGFTSRVLTGASCAQNDEGTSWHEDGRCLAGLRWAAKRVGPSTQRLDLFSVGRECRNSSRASGDMIAAFGNAHHLGQLLCLQAILYRHDEGFGEGFLLWLLHRVPNLLALQIAHVPWPPPIAFSFQSLRHLQLGLRHLQLTFQPAQQLPVLQTLCIRGYDSELPEVDLLGYRQLSKLMMDGCSTRRLRLEPFCHFSADVGIISNYSGERVWRAPFEGFLRLVPELSVFCQEPEYISLDSKGLFAGLPCLAVLNVHWPEEWSGGDEPDRDAFVDGAACLLTNCLASNGPPVLSLRVITITAICMQARIPGHLPNLEQLVILAEGRAELSFEEPEATILALKQFYVFGQLLKPDEMYAERMSVALAGTGRALGAALAQTAGRGFSGSSSCVYLRPAAAEALPIQYLYDHVAGLARLCRCGACFGCLSEAGRLDFLGTTVSPPARRKHDGAAMTQSARD